MQLNINSIDKKSPIKELGLINNYIDEFKSNLSEQRSSSSLTGSGYPLEMSFTTLSDKPRYTIDPFAHIFPAEERLLATVDLIKRDFLIDFDKSQLKWFKEVQAMRPEYGAWLGVREMSDGIYPKLYIEVDDNSEAKHWPELIDLQQQDRCLTMVGYTPSRGNNKKAECELYYRSRNIKPSSLYSLLSIINANQHASVMKTALENVYGRKLEGRLPGGTAGFSYAIDSEDQIKTLTLFIFCRSFFGRDRRTRHAFGALLESQGISSEHYLRLTKASVDNLSANTQHGLFAITVSSKGEISYGVGYCPVERVEDDC